MRKMTETHGSLPSLVSQLKRVELSFRDVNYQQFLPFVDAFHRAAAQTIITIGLYGGGAEVSLPTRHLLDENVSSDNYKNMLITLVQPCGVSQWRSLHPVDDPAGMCEMPDETRYGYIHQQSYIASMSKHKLIKTGRSRRSR
jgi:hypothetical protein